MNEYTLNSHWENPNGPRVAMKRVYYQKDVDELLERSFVFDSWDDIWEVQRAIFDRIKLYCEWAKCDKFFEDVGRYKKQVEVIKRLCSFWKCLNQIRANVVRIENKKRIGGV